MSDLLRARRVEFLVPAAYAKPDAGSDDERSIG